MKSPFFWDETALLSSATSSAEIFDTNGKKISVNNLQQPISIFLSNNIPKDLTGKLSGTLSSQDEAALFIVTVKDENSSLYLDVNTTEVKQNVSLLLRLHKSGTSMKESYNYSWNGNVEGFRTVVRLNMSGVYFLSLELALAKAGEENNSLSQTHVEASYNISATIVGCFFRNNYSDSWSVQGCQV